jgi:type II secretory pathway pseudopilin PulG
MKKNIKTIRYFNMIEVVLAMAVIALAMTSVLALLPVGLNASRDAIGLNYSADAANNIIGRMKNWAESYDNDSRFEDIFSDASSNTLPTGLPSAATIIKIDTASKLFGEELRAGKLSSADSTSNFTKRDTGLYQSTDSDLDNVFFIIQGRMENDRPKATLLDERNNVSLKIEVDFTAMVYLWKSEPTTSVKTSGSWATWPPSDTYSYFSAMNVEISWPASLNYVERERCYYYTEVKKPK